MVFSSPIVFTPIERPCVACVLYKVCINKYMLLCAYMYCRFIFTIQLISLIVMRAKKRGFEMP